MDSVVADEDDKLVLDMQDLEEVVEELINDSVANNPHNEENDEGTGRG